MEAKILCLLEENDLSLMFLEQSWRDPSFGQGERAGGGAMSCSEVPQGAWNDPCVHLEPAQPHPVLTCNHPQASPTASASNTSLCKICRADFSLCPAWIMNQQFPVSAPGCVPWAVTKTVPAGLMGTRAGGSAENHPQTHPCWVFKACLWPNSESMRPVWQRENLCTSHQHFPPSSHHGM